MRLGVRIFAVVVATLMSGCSGVQQQPEPQATPAKLVIATPHREEMYKPLIKEFQQRTGIWVQVETAGTPLLLERLANGTLEADVIFGGGVDSLAAYVDGFEPYRSPELEGIDPAYCPEGGEYTPFSTLPLVFFYNTKLLPYGTAPDSWGELLTPEWQGKVAFADPNVSSSCYTALCTAIVAQPDREPAEVIDSFFDCAALQSGSARIQEVVSDGSYMIGIVLEEAAVKQSKLRHDVDFLYPSDGSSALPDGTAIVKGCSNLQAAKKFIDFTISEDAQRLVVDMSRRPVRSDMSPKAGMLPIERIKLVSYDVQWSAENREPILARWNMLAAQGEGLR